MQKTILFLGAGLLLSTSFAAQAQYRGRGGNASLGIKAGASYTGLVGADVPSGFDYRFGFHAGVFANVGFSKLFAFQPELLYSQKGVNTGSDRAVRLHYLDIPLAFHINTDGFFVEAGPQVGFLVSSSNNIGSLTVTNTDLFNTVDVGYLFGLGYQKKHGPGVGLRYNGGFTNILKEQSIPLGTLQLRQRNSAFQLYVTYSFN